MKAKEKQPDSSLESELIRLREKVEMLENEKADLETVISMLTEHSDEVAENLFSEMENTVRESRRRVRRVSEIMPVPIIVSRIADSTIAYANNAACVFMGLPFERLMKYKISDFFNPPERDLIREHLERKNHLSNLELPGVKPDGNSFWGALFAQPFQFSDEHCYLNVIHDLTERKKEERERHRLVSVVEQVTQSIIITDRKGDILYVNPAFEQTMGFKKEEIIGRNFKIFKSDRHDDEFFRAMWEKISGGEPWTGKITNRKKNNDPCDFETTISCIRDSSGNIINFVSVNRDVTQEVRMEKQLRQAQKMEAIGTMAGGIAHDFNNILGGILGYTQLAAINLANPDKARSHLDKVLTSINRARDLVHQILTFSRQAEHEKRPIRISTVVKEILKLIRASLPSTITIQNNVGNLSETVLADPIQIHQLLMNLCINAAQAMEKQGGMLEVSLAEIRVLPESGMVDLEPGRYIKLDVKDTGMGIDPEIKDRIFEPFFTTKASGEGTGMGLSIVHGIVKSHGGTVICESEPGKGTAFQVFLPLLKADEQKERPPKVPESSVSGNERILFIDDEPELVEIFKNLLENFGYHVTTSTSAVEALKIFTAAPDQFDILITDQIMPHMTGVNLMKNIRAIKPQIPSIVTTGSTERLKRDEAIEMGFQDFFIKPVQIYELLKSIRQILSML